MVRRRSARLPNTARSSPPSAPPTPLRLEGTQPLQVCTPEKRCQAQELPLTACGIRTSTANISAQAGKAAQGSSWPNPTTAGIQHCWQIVVWSPVAVIVMKAPNVWLSCLLAISVQETVLFVDPRISSIAWTSSTSKPRVMPTNVMSTAGAMLLFPAPTGNTHKFMGIRNGIDTELWSPTENRFLPMEYDADTAEQGKRRWANNLGLLAVLSRAWGIAINRHACTTHAVADYMSTLASATLQLFKH